MSKYKILDSFSTEPKYSQLHKTTPANCGKQRQLIWILNGHPTHDRLAAQSKSICPAHAGIDPPRDSRASPSSRTSPESQLTHIVGNLGRASLEPHHVAQMHLPETSHLSPAAAARWPPSSSLPASTGAQHYTAPPARHGMAPRRQDLRLTVILLFSSITVRPRLL
jgi:hypothetical protein